MDVHLVDGTYELFRYFFAVPGHTARDERDVGAARAVVGSMLTLLEDGATHVGIATDHVIESFRNDLWPGYKDGSGVDPVLLAQFPLLEAALTAAGLRVFAMVEHEADDALASAARVAAADDRVERVLIATPDKDLAQCVVEGRVWQFDRRKRELIGPDEVIAKFGVPPESIPDYLALVGDSADGFPGLQGWGAKSAGAVLSRWGHVVDIPEDPTTWEADVRGAAKLAVTLNENRELAALFVRLATLVDDCETIDDVDELRWTGPTEDFASVADYLDQPALAERAARLADARA
ncbi:5'-3' exonuclease [Actinomarinicola tropica]|uniref:5'-3' exonuclease n=1 Tax=Actinomarinicola tropica TaxID=2789776 RepID=A0A5Q2RNQ4_9ACTN|nr:5'-3' exonuclease H3TH domain-containing protein [Actinomarinicola tropica]QGG96582.1 flap endonuclease [Actinomarinicola tropica]